MTRLKPRPDPPETAPAAQVLSETRLLEIARHTASSLRLEGFEVTAEQLVADFKTGAPDGRPGE